jgi:hypothetical protein
MEGSCVRAVELGPPAIMFTEHLDHTVWRIALTGPYVMDHLTALADHHGRLRPPVFDAHLPDLVGHGFRDAAQMAEAHGFRPGKNPYDLWGRVD